MSADLVRDAGCAALGEALAARHEEILRECQRHYLDAIGPVHPGDPIWRVTSLATVSIVRRLRDAKGPGRADRARITNAAPVTASRPELFTNDSLGPIDQMGSGSNVTQAARWSETLARSPGMRTGLTAPRVTPLVTLTFWWSDVTTRVLTEEADRLGVDRDRLRAATAMVASSARTNLVDMATHWDAAIASLHRRLTALVPRDPVTGLATRSALLDQLGRALARLSRQPAGLALIVVGVDDFSGLHDRYGLDSRNAVLSELGSRLSAGARPGDLVTRVGEDEFAVLFENLIGPSEAERRADVLRASAAAPFSAAGTRVRITVSVGVATVRRPGKHAEEVVAHAILAMNRAKRAGGNQVAVIEIDRGRPVVVADRSIVAAGQPGDHRARPG